MRLKEQEIELIKKAFREVFQEGEIYLFGSRVDDNKRGGDIDLFVVPKDRSNLRQKKIKFLVKLDLYLGEQKIDVILPQDPNRTIEQEAVTQGVKL